MLCTKLAAWRRRAAAALTSSMKKGTSSRSLGAVRRLAPRSPWKFVPCCIPLPHQLQVSRFLSAPAGFGCFPLQSSSFLQISDLCALGVQGPERRKRHSRATSPNFPSFFFCKEEASSFKAGIGQRTQCSYLPAVQILKRTGFGLSVWVGISTRKIGTTRNSYELPIWIL
jgi:hypothetical protein